MKIQEKLEYLQTKHPSEWVKAIRESEDIVSDSLPLMCLCGRLATGLHERNCRKYRSKVIREAVKKLKHLIKK